MSYSRFIEICENRGLTPVEYETYTKELRYILNAPIDVLKELMNDPEVPAVQKIFIRSILDDKSARILRDLRDFLFAYEQKQLEIAKTTPTIVLKLHDPEELDEIDEILKR